MRKVTEETPVAIQKTYEFVLWLVKKVEHFPRSYRFTVGDRLTLAGLDLLTTLVEAAYSRRKDTLLEIASQKVNSIRYLLRLSKDLQLMSVDSYGFSVENLDEIGRMVGGWRKSLGTT
jgi:four helix bundle protein